jgi:DNA-binding transcriptional LysR family regulator
MHMQALQIFRDVARARSFSRGASTNGVSQSAASQAISQLEKHLEVQLIDRSQRPLVLTSAGQIFYEGCKSLLDRYDTLENEVRAYNRRWVGTLRIASIYSIGLHHLPDYTNRFSADHRDARVRIECLPPERVYEAVLEDEADLGLVSYPRHDRRLTAIEWRNERMVVVCPTSSPLTRKAQLDPVDLEGQRFVAFDRDLPIRQALDRYLKRHRVSVEVALEFDNIENIKQAISRNTGLSILPETTVQAEVDSRQLSVLPLNGGTLVRPLAIIHRRGKKFTPTVQAFLDLLCNNKRDGTMHNTHNTELQTAPTGSTPPSFRGDATERESGPAETAHRSAKEMTA